MPFFAIVIIVVTVVVLFNLAKPKGGSGAVRGNGGRTNVRRPSAPLRMPPECLGVPAGHPARPAAERLEAALTTDFEARVKDRVLRHAPNLRDIEWQWRWFELKRYFLMCGVLRGVPMYSDRVDEVWHEMLMFTREYEEFCKKFCGQLIHHAPHAPDSKPNPGERALFDWVYGELFLPASGSAGLWGAFYRTPMPRGLMLELETHGAEELRNARFNARSAGVFPDLNATVDYLIERGRRLAASRNEPLTNNVGGDDWTSSAMLTGMMSAGLFYYSWGSEGQFRSQMDGLQTEEERRNNDSACGSSYSCSGDGGTDGGGGDGSPGGGGSSCGGGSDGGGGGSSCGSGSGSSCGGGSSCGSN